jgi:hypothetical protein
VHHRPQAQSDAIRAAAQVEGHMNDIVMGRDDDRLVDLYSDGLVYPCRQSVVLREFLKTAFVEHHNVAVAVLECHCKVAENDHATEPAF